MSLKVYKENVYYNYGYLTIDKKFKLTNSFEQQALVNSLWLLSLANKLSKNPEENIFKLVKIDSDIKNLLTVIQNVPISNLQDKQFIEGLTNFFQQIFNRQSPFINGYKALEIKLSSLLTIYNENTGNLGLPPDEVNNSLSTDLNNNQGIEEI